MAPQVVDLDGFPSCLDCLVGPDQRSVSVWRRCSGSRAYSWASRSMVEGLVCWLVSFRSSQKEEYLLPNTRTPQL